MTLNDILTVVLKYHTHEIGYWNVHNKWIPLWKGELTTTVTQILL